MSSNEKSYFLKYANIYNQKDKLYLLLYEKISKSKEYDEANLKLLFESNYANNFGMLKEQLYEKILSSLVQYNKDSSNENKIFRWVEEGKILQKKGLLKQAEKKFLKALDYSKKYERFYLIINIYSHLKTIIMHNLYESVDYEQIANIMNEEDKYMKIISNIQKLNNMQFFYYYNESKSNFNEMKKIVEDDLLHKWTTYPTFIEKSICLNILSNYYENIADKKLSLNFVKKHIELFENDNIIKNEYYNNYLLQKFNLISISISNGELDIAKENLNMFDKEIPIKIYQKLFYILYYSNQLLLDCIQNNYELFMKNYNQMVVKYQELNQIIPLKLRSHINFYKVILLFNNKDYKTSLKEINSFINQTNPDSNNSNLIFLAILCYIEVNDYNTLKIFLVIYKKEVKALKNKYPEEFIFINAFIESSLHNQFDDKFLNQYKKEIEICNQFLYPFNFKNYVDERIKTSKNISSLE